MMVKWGVAVYLLVLYLRNRDTTSTSASESGSGSDIGIGGGGSGSGFAGDYTSQMQALQPVVLVLVGAMIHTLCVGYEDTMVRSEGEMLRVKNQLRHWKVACPYDARFHTGRKVLPIVGMLVCVYV